ncbi:immunoglobulin-like domain-containing protein [Treponema maltophilum]|uniref:immunoglobulin-like domain-containing protein n=1 Tax=Treponema maltophilum TaxID=51160 RepID=UPI0003A56941
MACPSSVSQDFILQKNVDGYPTATIAWESADDKIIKIESGSDVKGIVGYDLIDRTVKLTATVHYNSGTGIKEFNVTVEHFANKIKRENSKYVREYEFTGTELVITETKKDDNVLQRGAKYIYTDVQTASNGTKTAVFSKTADYDKNEEKWVTRQEYLQEQKALVMQGLAELNRLKGLNTLKLRDFETLYSIITADPQAATEEQLFGFVQYLLNISETYEQFAPLPDGTKSTILKNGIPYAETIFNESLTAIVNGRFPSRRYIYSFNGSGRNLRFNTSLPYDSGKPWYEQEGGYDFQSSVQNNASHPAPAGTIMFIYFRVNKSGANTYSAYIAVHKADGSGKAPQCDNRNNDVPFTPPNSPITATLVEDGNPSNQLNIEIKNISVSSDGLTMNADIKIDSGTFESYELKFRGDSLPLY